MASAGDVFGRVVDPEGRKDKAWRVSVALEKVLHRFRLDPDDDDQLYYTGIDGVERHMQGGKALRMRLGKAIGTQRVSMSRILFRLYKGQWPNQQDMFAASSRRNKYEYAMSVLEGRRAPSARYQMPTDEELAQSPAYPEELGKPVYTLVSDEEKAVVNWWKYPAELNSRNIAKADWDDLEAVSNAWMKLRGLVPDAKAATEKAQAEVDIWQERVDAQKAMKPETEEEHGAIKYVRGRLNQTKRVRDRADAFLTRVSQCLSEAEARIEELKCCKAATDAT